VHASSVNDFKNKLDAHWSNPKNILLSIFG